MIWFDESDDAEYQISGRVFSFPNQAMKVQVSRSAAASSISTPKQGAKALENRLENEGVKNIDAVNEAMTTARPWWAQMGLAAGA
jgi:hypothetical protein